MIWQKWRRKKSKKKKKRTADRVREAAVECPSENELSFEGELEQTVAIGFFGRGVSDTRLVEIILVKFWHIWSNNFVHSFEGQLEEFVIVLRDQEKGAHCWVQDINGLLIGFQTSCSLITSALWCGPRGRKWSGTSTPTSQPRQHLVPSRVVTLYPRWVHCW